MLLAPRPLGASQVAKGGFDSPVPNLFGQFCHSGLGIVIGRERSFSIQDRPGESVTTKYHVNLRFVTPSVSEQ